MSWKEWKGKRGKKKGSPMQSAETWQTHRAIHRLRICGATRPALSADDGQRLTQDAHGHCLREEIELPRDRGRCSASSAAVMPGPGSPEKQIVVSVSGEHVTGFGPDHAELLPDALGIGEWNVLDERLGEFHRQRAAVGRHGG